MSQGEHLWPLLSYNQFRTIDSVIEIQRADALDRTGALMFGCAKMLYISLCDGFLFNMCACVCVYYITSCVCLWIVGFTFEPPVVKWG